MTRSNDEVRLLVKASYGDNQAFTALFKAYKDITYSFARKICHSSVLAEEVVQDVFMNIWINRAKLKDIKNFGGYLRVTTKNQALQALRKLAIEARTQNISIENWQELHNETESAIAYNESFQVLNRVLQALPPQQKLVYELCQLHGLKNKEVAEQLHLSPLTVKAHLRQAVQRIRASFIAETVLMLCLIIFCLKKI